MGTPDLTRWQIPEPLRKIGTASWLTLGAAALGVAVLLLLAVARTITVPLILGVMFGIAAFPLTDRFERRIHRRSLAALAVTALAGQVTVAAFTEDRLAAPEIMAFLPRIEAREDPELEAMGAAFRHAARVTVHTNDGRRLHHEELNRRASPENPVNAAEVEEKFRANLAGILTSAEQDLIVTTVARFEDADLAPMLALLGAKR